MLRRLILSSSRAASRMAMRSVLPVRVALRPFATEAPKPAQPKKSGSKMWAGIAAAVLIGGVAYWILKDDKGEVKKVPIAPKPEEKKVEAGKPGEKKEEPKKEEPKKEEPKKEEPKKEEKKPEPPKVVPEPDPRKMPYWGVAGTKKERTFIAVKPDGVQRALVGEIIARFERKGFKLVGLKMIWPSKKMAEEHYADLKAKPFFKGLTDYFSSGPVVAMCWEGRGVIKSGRVLLGATKPAESAPGTIRGDFGVDTGRNICHGSDSPAGAEHELAFWFKKEEIADWQPSNSAWVYE